MNKRIQDLAKQATNYIDPTINGGVCWELDQQRFAELIIQDCISQVAMIGVSNCDDPDVVWTVDKTIQNIKQHFDVEP